MAAEVSRRQDEDVWSWVEIGESFPVGPMRVKVRTELTTD